MGTTATKTYYFDSYSNIDPWEDNPESMVDGEKYTWAAIITDGEEHTQHLNNNTCNEKLNFDITKVETRIRKWQSHDTTIIKYRPVFSSGNGSWVNFIAGNISEPEYTSWKNITNDTNSPNNWTWDDVKNLEFDVYGIGTGDISGCRVSICKVRVTFFIPMKIVSDSHTVYFSNLPKKQIRTIGSEINTYNFPDGNEDALNLGKTNDSLTLSVFMDNLNASEKLNTIEKIMNKNEVITISGLPDSYLNKKYLISDMDAKKRKGYEHKYEVQLTFERRYDRLI